MIFFFLKKIIIPVRGGHCGYSLQASKNLAMPLAAYNNLNICVVYFVFLCIFMTYFPSCCQFD